MDEKLLLARHLSGKYVGELTDDEFVIFDHLLEEGVVRRVFVGAAGLIGLAKIGLTDHARKEMERVENRRQPSDNR